MLEKERDDFKKTYEDSTYKKKEKESSFFWRFSSEAKRLRSNKEYIKKKLEYEIASLRVKKRKEIEDTKIHPSKARYHSKIRRLEEKLEYMEL